MQSTSSLVVSIDQSTTSTKVNVYDSKSNSVFSEIKPHQQITPHSGWLEHDPIEILNNLKELIDKASQTVDCTKIECIGITNQRETVVAWNKNTGKPYYNAIVWCDGRTLEIATRYINKYNGNKENFKEINGLPISTYFTAFKIRWILENVPAVFQEIDQVLFGTIDSWIIWNLTNQHLTDVTNASRTFLMDLKNLSWSPELLKEFDILEKCLPKILSNCDDFGIVQEGPFKGIPITGCLGDQQAAALGHCLFEVGQAKNTYGTGCFLLVNIGNQVKTVPGLISTVCFKLGKDHDTVYAFEGAIETGANTINWMKDKLGLFSSFEELERLVESVENNGGVYFVPAFSGLYSPEWKESATGTIIGLTAYASKAHIIRACLEAVCYRTRDVLECAEKHGQIKIKELNVDGGITKNQFVLQFQADVLQKVISKPKTSEATCFGAAIAAGLHKGVFKNIDEVKSFLHYDHKTKFNIQNKEQTEKDYSKWCEAVKRSFDWAN